MPNYMQTDPIYIFTYFLQRTPIPPVVQGGWPGGVDHETEPVSQSGYRIVPGRLVEVWFYNTANGKYQPARDSDGSLMEFWQPAEFMSYKAFTFFCDTGKDWAGTAATDPYSSQLLSRNDVVKIKFTNEHRIPAGADGNPYPCGMYSSTDQHTIQGEKLADIAGCRA